MMAHHRIPQARPSWPGLQEALRKAATDPAARARVARRARADLRAWALSRRQHLPPLPPVHIPDGPIVRPGLRVAVILDPFSELAFRYEWDQVAVTPQDWRDVLSTEPPALLFVESAWQGNQGTWRLAMTQPEGPDTALCELVGWCRQHGIPTVFWNKEDPPNYDRFIATARLFDHVLTVDADRIPAYRRDLCHDRVGLLPFGAQPRIHTPVRRGPAHIHPIAFAGSYFAAKHVERRQQMDALLPAAQQHGLHIYSRLQSEDDRYQFPARYQRDVVGSLPYEQMLAATTAYQLFLNVNSVTRSPSMCARRLFELSAAQAPVLSGPAASIAVFFGDTITIAHDDGEARLHLGALMNQPEIRDRLGLRAHRRVFDRHLYGHRVDEVLRTVGQQVEERQRPISAVVPTMRPSQVDHVVDALAAQVYPAVEVVLVTHGFTVDVDRVRGRARDAGLEDLIVVPAEPTLTLGACMNRGVAAASGDYVAKVDDDNYYAPHYLSDLVRAFDYSEADVVGKWAHYVHLQSTGATLLRFGHAEHRFVDLVQGGTLLMPAGLARSVRFENLPRRVDTTFLDKVRRGGGKIYAADRFNFVSVRAATTEGHTWTIKDEEILARSSRLQFYGDPREHVTV